MPSATTQLPASRRGGIYIAVLGSSMLVTLIGLSALAMVRAQRLAVERAIDTDAARLYAESAVELGIQWIASNPNWRTTYTSGNWATNVAMADGKFSLAGVDPTDGNLANRLTDPLVLTGTGIKGSAQQMVQVTLVPATTPIDALKMAIHTAGEFHIRSGKSLLVSGAPASTNTTLRNDGTITGNAECLASTGGGTVTGNVKILAATKAMPDPGLMATYTALGTVISPPSTIEKTVLAPAVNPWVPAATNADGVYVINLSSNLTIRRCRINGTLVINGPGRTVSIENNVLIHPYRADYPVLITNAKLVIKHVSGTSLSESSEGANFNPPAAPYLGVSNSNMTDTFPSEVQGLVHARDLFEMDNTARVRGLVICESAALSDAVNVPGTPEIIYDPLLYSNPPMGYTKYAAMAVKPGSWKQVVLP